jgi:hypothetical protein
MNKMFSLLAALCFTLSACSALATPQPQAAGPAPLSDADIQATVAIQVEQTLQSLPTPTLAPTNTPMVLTATSSPTLVPSSTPTETQKPPLLTLTATLATSTVTLTAAAVGTLPFTSTPNPAVSVTPTETNHYQYYGTMPPNLPSGYITMINMSKTDVYISLQCTTQDGHTTIIEYPLGGSRVSTSAPAGKYVYVASVGGHKFTGKFKLDTLQDLKIIIYKDRIEIK